METDEISREGDADSIKEEDEEEEDAACNEAAEHLLIAPSEASVSMEEMDVGVCELAIALSSEAACWAEAATEKEEAEDDAADDADDAGEDPTAATRLLCIS